MKLREKQSLFVNCLTKLLAYGLSKGYEFTLGEGYDDDFQGHMHQSLHYIRLAQDLNLFVGGEYIKSSHPAWDDLGAYWKGLNPLCRWGGDFKARDYNHFSVTHNGKA